MNADSYDPNTVTCPVYRAPDGAHDKCAKFNQSCPHWTYVQGKNPATGQDISRWGCGFAWTPVLLVNLVMKLDGLAAAINDLRNQSVIRQDQGNAMARAQLQAARDTATATKSLVERVVEREAGAALPSRANAGIPRINRS